MIEQPLHQPQLQDVIELAEVLGRNRARQETREVAKSREPLPTPPTIPLGQGRDRDAGFRALADTKVHKLLLDWRIDHELLTLANRSSLEDHIVKRILT
ncbi:hypothetical protein [Hyphomonas sp.]|uniref:hypothetical protein n=1 Tax=Hyphomonas sp. TaxID=87 RepID=UPI0025C68512|nr:hypothetical protein [Hyphomonas sp.]